MDECLRDTYLKRRISVADTCKSCDGKGINRKEVKDNFGFTEHRCSKCNGSGFEPGPSKGKRRFFKNEELSPEEMSLEEQTQAFLRKHGY
jgi:DnaJ-class molecular chaperone